jgi:ABC-type sugar transport system ATPase subunit
MEDHSLAIIQLKDVTKKFPGVLALDHITLSIFPGEVHGIIGENGAGKSTLINILAGELQPDEGTVYFKGHPVTISNPLISHSLGISVVFQELALCTNLNIAENISLWKVSDQPLLAWRNKKLFEGNAKQALDELGFTGVDLNLPVGQLSVAKQQLVEIAKAISTKAEVLILDEPNSALTQEESEHLFQIVRRLRAAGVTILYVSHHLDEVLELADRITVLRDGRLIDTVQAGGTTIPHLIERMVGRNLVTTPREFSSRKSTAALEVTNLSSPGTIKGLSFNIYGGEFVGIAGLPDSHKDELVECLFGLRPYQGEVRINDQPVEITTPSDAIDRGMCLVPADRRGAGAFLTLSLQDNTVASNLGSVSQNGFLKRGAIRKIAQRFVEDLDIRASSLSQLMANLSGGNQQKVILARGLATDPSVLVLHEPTRGIDVGAKAEIYRILQGLAAQGSAILIVSSELPELISQCDRILVMHDGALSGVFDHTEASEEAILACMMGHAEHL